MIALIRALKEIARHPVSLLPALIVLIAIGLVLFLIMDNFYELFINTVFLEQVPDSTIAALPFHFFSLHAIDLTVLFIGWLVSAALIIGLGFFYAHYAKELEKPSVSECFSKTIAELGSIIAVLVFFVFLALLISILFWFFLLLGAVEITLFLILSILLAIGVFYLVVKIAFVIPIMAIENQKLKAALASSWEFTNKRFLGTLIFIILLSIIASIIVSIGTAVSDLVLEDMLSIIVFAVFMAVLLAYIGFALSLHYIENPKK